MYQSENAYSEMPDKQAEQPMLQDVANRISKQNVEYFETLHQIEEKLHSIFNIRTPETISDRKKETPINNDFYSGISEQLSVMQTNNNRLQQVFEHLKRIVG